MSKIKQFNMNDKLEIQANKLLKQYPRLRKEKRIKIFNIIHKLNLEELDNVIKYLSETHPEYIKEE